MIIECQCGQKNRVPDNAKATSRYRCGKCKRDLHLLITESQFVATKEYLGKGHPKRLDALGAAGLAAFLLIFTLVFYRGSHDIVSPTPHSTAGSAVPVATSPTEAREREIIVQDAGKLGDPQLNRDHQGVNERYFGNRLSRIPVIWEPRLKEVGPLIGASFELKGLWSAEPRLILLNPAISRNPAETRRVLCHEMVHEYLFNLGDTKTRHGAAFQSELRRLQVEGAFQAIRASEDEKTSLRSWLKAESTRLEGESAGLQRENSELDRMRDEIDREKGNVERENDELNQRISSANEQGYGWPSDGEIEAFKDKSRVIDQRVADFNANVADFDASVERHNADSKRFNHNASRYNLMMAYPDGLDEESVIQPKSAAVQKR